MATPKTLPQLPGADDLDIADLLFIWQQDGVPRKITAALLSSYAIGRSEDALAALSADITGKLVTVGDTVFDGAYSLSTERGLGGSVPDGYAVAFRVHETSVGDDTLDVDGTGGYPIVRRGGVNVAAGDLAEGDVYLVTFDGAAEVYRVLSTAGSVQSFAGRVGGVVPEDGDYDADQVLFDNEIAALPGAPARTQAAIEALNTARVAAGPLAPHRGLTLANGSVADDQVDVAADALIVTRPAGTDARLLADIDVTADITASGAGGLDDGAPANETWYYVWIVTKAGGGDPAAMLSTSAAASGLTLPQDYTHAGLVGAMYRDSGGDFVRATQRGRCVERSNYTILSSGGLSGPNPIDISTAVPPIAQRLGGRARLDNTGGSPGTCIGTVSSIGASNGEWILGVNIAAGGNIRGSWTVINVERDTIYYGASDPDSELTLEVRWWEY